ncbi:hypothetical protein [Micromonospora sp. NPDC093277]|uniref:hypothetical protein n=1 Tax=Micromonospora sp. NPDC093277 TaxID=3364291 RepID=UPI0038112832
MADFRTALAAVALGAATLGAAGACDGGAAGSADARASAASGGTATAPAGGLDPNAPEVSEQGDIPDNQAYVGYTPASGEYTVRVPEGWSRVDQPNTVTFTDKLNTVRVDLAARAVAPTEADVHTEIATLGAGKPGFSAGTVTTVRRKAGSAVLASYRIDAPPNSVTGKVINDDVERYEFWHNGQLVTLTLSGPHGADNVDPWRLITDSVTWNR